jgi:hypothetical protein
VLSVGGGASEHFDSDAECLRAFEAAAGEFGEPEAAAEHLERRGYGRVAMSATFARPAGQPGFSAPPGIEVELLEGDSMVEAFGNVLAPAYHLDRNGDGFIFGLPGRREWRTYLAADENGPIAAAAMMMHVGRPQLAFAGSLPGCRRRGGHMALLHRQIEDGIAWRAGEVFAITDEEPGFPEVISPGARNLLRAGFRLVDVRSVWRPPEELIAQVLARSSMGGQSRRSPALKLQPATFASNQENSCSGERGGRLSGTYVVPRDEPYADRGALPADLPPPVSVAQPPRRPVVLRRGLDSE